MMTSTYGVDSDTGLTHDLSFTQKKQPGLFKPSPGMASPKMSFRPPSASSAQSGETKECAVVPSLPPVRRHTDMTDACSHEINVVVDGQTFKAAASALMLASPVWYMMLQDALCPDQKTAATTATPPVLNLDGSAKAMATLLSIVHYRFAEVPGTLTLPELYELCLTMAQYKVTRLTYPWARGWLAHLNLMSAKAGATTTTPTKDIHKALWIAYTLGEKTLYKSMLQSIVLNLSCDADGRLAIAGAAKLDDMMLPPGLLDIITETRTVLLDTMLSGVASAIDTEDGLGGNSICRVGKDVAECESMVIGSAIRELRRHKLFPNIPKAGDYASSVQVLVDTLMAIKSLTFVGQGSPPHESHDSCGLGLRAMAVGILADIPLVITDEHEQHLCLQGLESGISCDLARPDAGIETRNLADMQLVDKRAHDLTGLSVKSPSSNKSSHQEEPETVVTNLGIRQPSPCLNQQDPAVPVAADGVKVSSGW